MQTSSIDFDISQFTSLLQQDPTRKNGWSALYNGELDSEEKKGMPFYCVIHTS